MSTPREDDLVLVTGASGFLGMHCIVQLLAKGYRVRGTLRDLGRASWLMEVIGKHAEVRGRLSLVKAELGSDAGWPEAVAGCSYALHVASPVPVSAPKHPDDVIVPARDGTLRVLRAAAKAGVRRVVLTSSTAAVFYGHARDGKKTYDENDWSNLTAEVGPYEQSKTLAERAAWDYVKSLPAEERMELVALQPGAILGPVLDKDFSLSGEIVRKFMTREFPGCPDLGFALADVRDVAGAHVQAMTLPAAAGQRFILALEHVPMTEIARILAAHFGPRGFKIPTRRVPSWVIKLAGMFDKTTALAVPELGKRQDVSSARARAVLGWQPRSVERMVVDMGESMIECGVFPVPGARPGGMPQATSQS
ncbi:MAG TPA: aldehyde reductase [Polyangiaceae bacterium]|jgi:nucleoside-diphosphate-sugar epimerase